MKMKKFWISLVMIATMFMSGYWVIAATENYTEYQKNKNEIMAARKQLDRYVLKGLPGVMPDISIGSVGDVPCLLTEKELQTQVELRLRHSRIKVLSETDEQYTMLPIVVVVSPESPFYKIEASIRLIEGVYLLRDPKKITVATTWESGHSASFAKEFPTKTEILEVVNGLLDQFINDYLAANPKDQPTTEKPPAKRDN